MMREADARRHGGAGSQAPGARPAVSADQHQRAVHQERLGRLRRRSRRTCSTPRRRPDDTVTVVPQQPADRATDFWQYQAQVTQTLFRWDQWQQLKRADAEVAARRGQLPRCAAGPAGARLAGLFRRARGRGHADRRRGDAAGVQPPARAGGEALRGRADRDHRRAGSARRARQRDRRGDRRQARAREHQGSAARTDRRGLPDAAASRPRRCRSTSRSRRTRRAGSRRRSSRTWT